MEGGRRRIRRLVLENRNADREMLFGDTSVYQFLEGIKHLTITNENCIVILRLLGYYTCNNYTC